jgi:hypothetical protein
MLTKTFTFPAKPIRTSKLSQELQQLPGLAPWRDALGNLQAAVLIRQTASETVIETLEAGTQAAVQGVYDAHDPATLLPAEQDAQARLANEATIYQQAEAAFDQLELDLVVLMGSPTNTQVLTILQRVIRVVRGIVRLLLRKLEGTS